MWSDWDECTTCIIHVVTIYTHTHLHTHTSVHLPPRTVQIVNYTHNIQEMNWWASPKLKARLRVMERRCGAPFVERESIEKTYIIYLPKVSYLQVKKHHRSHLLKQSSLRQRQDSGSEENHSSPSNTRNLYTPPAWTRGRSRGNLRWRRRSEEAWPALPLVAWSPHPPTWGALPTRIRECGYHSSNCGSLHGPCP